MWPAHSAAFAWMIYLSMVSLILPTAAYADPMDENTLKATLTLNFARYTEWPEGSFHSAEENIDLCLIGSHAVADAFAAAIHGKTVKKRKLHLRNISPTEPKTGCHILYVSGLERRALPSLLAPIADSPILTIGETGGFLNSGGIIQLVLQDNKIAFLIQAEAAQRHHLHLSALLLRHAINTGKPAKDTSS